MIPLTPAGAPRAPSGAQERWMSALKAKIDRHSNGYLGIVQSPEDVEYAGTGIPALEKFYLKPVIVIAPHKTHPNIPIKCNACSDGFLSPSGWDTSRRYVHGMRTGLFLLQYRYVCRNDCCARNRGSSKAKTSGLEMLSYTTTPDIFKTAIVTNNLFMTDRGGVIGALIARFVRRFCHRYLSFQSR
jgi:hypothetical protein